MNNLKVYLFNIGQNFLNNPLSMIRVILPYFYTKVLLGHLNALKSVENNEPYSLSLTWINSLFPTEFLVNESNFQFYFYLIVVCTILAIIGLFGRLSLFLLAFSGFIIVGMIEGVGTFDHRLSLSSQVLLMLSLLPGTMAFSIDCWFISFFRKGVKLKYTAPEIIKLGTNLLLIVLILTYFTAGLSKLRYGGINWLDGATLSFYIKDHTGDYEEGKKQLLIGRNTTDKDFKWKGKYNLYSHTYGNYRGHPKIREINTWLGSNKLIMSGLSVLTIILEMGGFIVFINPRLRNMYLLSAIGMHSSIGFVMGLPFLNYKIICLCLMDWESAYDSVRGIFQKSVHRIRRFNNA